MYKYAWECINMNCVSWVKQWKDSDNGVGILKNSDNSKYEHTFGAHLLFDFPQLLPTFNIA